MRFKAQAMPIVFLFIVQAPILFADDSNPQTHPFTVHDLLAMERISDPQVSPDGSRIVFVRRTTDLEANRGRTDLWLVDVDGANQRRLTSHPAGEHIPRWSPDGKTVFFLSSRTDRSQVWKIRVDGGEAEQVTHLPLEVGTFALSPNGTRLVLSMEVFPDAPTVQDTVKRLEEEKNRKSTGRIYKGLFIRHWDTWKDGRRSHLFAMSLAGGEPVDLMKGLDADTPTKPFGGTDDYTFSPDGKHVVFVSRMTGREESWSVDFDLYAVPTDGSAAPRCLTDDNEAWDAHPVFSPDGRTLAYLAMATPGYEADRFRIVLRQWPEGRSRVLTDKWDRSPGTIVWSADGKTIYTTASNVGQRSLFAVDAASGDARTLVRDGTISSPAVAAGRIVFGLNHLRSPVELHSVRSNGSDLQPITRVNTERLATAKMGAAEQFTFSGWNDEKVHAYVVKPVDFDSTKQYPVAFLIHGGPQGSFGNRFHYRWNPQTYAGRGYGVVMVDFHGSTGYGQAFADSIRGDWGGKPLVDLRKGLAAALARYPWLDGERVAALGASYGGYMINWIAGNWPERFRCLVNHDGVFNTRMMYFDTEELWFPEWDNRGTPWGNPSAYRQNNPVEFVGNWKTPMLVIHGALDYRVVETQGLGAFTACQRQGIPSKLLYFPDENHWVLKPHNSILWHDTVLDWLDQWTK